MNKQTLLKEIEESKMWYDRVKEDNTYKRDLAKRIELINWVLENMKNPDTQNTQICALTDQVKKKFHYCNHTSEYNVLERDRGRRLKCTCPNFEG